MILRVVEDYVVYPCLTSAELHPLAVIVGIMAAPSQKSSACRTSRSDGDVVFATDRGRDKDSGDGRGPTCGGGMRRLFVIWQAEHDGPLMPSLGAMLSTACGATSRATWLWNK